MQKLVPALKKKIKKFCNKCFLIENNNYLDKHSLYEYKGDHSDNNVDDDKYINYFYKNANHRNDSCISFTSYDNNCKKLIE